MTETIMEGREITAITEIEIIITAAPAEIRIKITEITVPAIIHVLEIITIIQMTEIRDGIITTGHIITTLVIPENTVQRKREILISV